MITQKKTLLDALSAEERSFIEIAIRSGIGVTPALWWFFS
jgi:hypothetical protein